MGFIQQSVSFNTNFGTTNQNLLSPTGGLGDSFAYGTPGTNTPLDGPEPVDQNNGWGHFSFSSNANQTWTVPFQKSALIGCYAATLDFFAAANGVNPPSGLKAVVQ
jgi:hypothetical protein